MITVTPEMIAEGVRELQERALLNLITGDIDVFRILADLERDGKKNAWVARQIGASKTTVAGWKAGRRPSFIDVCRLAVLHEKHCRK